MACKAYTVEQTDLKDELIHKYGIESKLLHNAINLERVQFSIRAQENNRRLHIAMLEIKQLQQEIYRLTKNLNDSLARYDIDVYALRSRISYLTNENELQKRFISQMLTIYTSPMP